MFLAFSHSAVVPFCWDLVIHLPWSLLPCGLKYQYFTIFCFNVTHSMCWLGDTKVWILITILKWSSLIYSKSNMAKKIFPFVLTLLGWLAVVICVLRKPCLTVVMFIRQSSDCALPIQKLQIFQFCFENCFRKDYLKLQKKYLWHW